MLSYDYLLKQWDKNKFYAEHVSSLQPSHYLTILLTNQKLNRTTTGM